MRTYRAGWLLVTPRGGDAALELATMANIVVTFTAREKPLRGAASSAIDEAAFGTTATIQAGGCTFNPATIAALEDAAAGSTRADSAVVPFGPLTARFDFLDPLDGKQKRTTLRNVLTPGIIVPFGRERLTLKNVTLFGYADEKDIVAETDLLPPT